MKIVLALACAVGIGWGASLAAAKPPNRTTTIQGLAAQVTQLKTQVSALKSDLDEPCSGCQRQQTAALEAEVSGMVEKLRALCSGGRLVSGFTATSEGLVPQYVGCPEWP